jgi:hypothetical protein
MSNLVKPHVNEQKLSLQDTVKECRPHLRKRYKQAAFSILSKRNIVDVNYAKASTFVKFEKIPIGKVEDGKPPRLIQYRSYEYLLLLRRSIINHAKAIKNSDITYVNGQPLKEIFTKTMNNTDMANSILRSWNSFVNPVAVCLDHSKFDGHYTSALLELEHYYWNITLGQDHLRDLLLKMQLNNKGYTQNGIRYKVKGTRLSGEFTTSEGNTTLNLAMITTWIKKSGIEHYRIHVNGDDSIIVIDEAEHKKLLPLNYFENFNMETGLEALAFDFRNITYCQSSPIRVSGEWRMVKDPYRTMSRFCYCDSKYMKCIDRYILGSSLCELAVSAGVPMLQAWAVRFIAKSSSAKPLGSVDKYPARLNNKDEISTSDISAETRTDFEVAFGISVQQQISFERMLAGNTNVLADIKKLNTILLKYKTFHLN